MPTLEEIFGKQQQPTLEQIFNAPPQGQIPQVAPIAPDNKEKDIYDILGDAGRALLSPASTALELISQIDKPRGAIAGGLKALQDDTDFTDGLAKGWKDNTSFKELFPEQFKKDDPYYAATIGGFLTDVALDPMWLLPPAKIAKGVVAGSKAVGLTDNVINPAVNAVKGTEAGAKAVASLEDIFGVNRVAGVQNEFNRGIAEQGVKNADYTDELNKLGKEYGDDISAKATSVIEAAERPTSPALTITPNMQADILDSVKNGTVYKQIKDGVITREDAFTVLRDAGEEIPDQLLQTAQRQAKEAGQAIPDYVYRDEVLNSISDPKARKAVQTITDKVIEQNKKFSDEIYGIGRIGDAEWVEFMGGAHLRRSYEKFETAEDFLKSVKKNGTDEEWQKAYAQYQKNKQGVGPSAKHKIDQRDFMKRQTLSDETMKKMGIVTDAEYRVMDTFSRASKTLQEDKYLTKVNQLFGKTEAEAAALSRNLPKNREYVPIPESKSYGALAGKWVPRDVANQVMKLTGTGAPSSDLAKSWQKVVSWWKVAKLAAPAPIMRNLYSGLPMANVFGKVPMQALPQDMARVLQSFSNGGKNNAFIREFRGSGALEGEWVGNELKNILGGKPTGIKKMAEMGMEAFGTPDKFWRAVVYSYHRRQGKSVAEAGVIARKALLDYSAAPDWINTISKTGIMPFAKFPFMAGKETAKALWENPASVTKYTKLQNQTNTEDREKILPDYLKAKTLLPAGEGTRMVNGKPQKVQQNIDLSYILPFASDFSFGNPVTDAMLLAKTGRNGIGQQVIKPGMTDKEKTEAWSKYIANAVAPSAISPYNVEKLYNASQGNVDSKGRQYDMGDALWQTLGGVKNVPINTEEIFKQSMGKIRMEQRDIQDVMRSIAKDQSLPKAQKEAKIKEHQSQLQQLGKKASEMQKAYDREKKRGAI